MDDKTENESQGEAIHSFADISADSAVKGHEHRKKRNKEIN